MLPVIGPKIVPGGEKINTKIFHKGLKFIYAIFLDKKKFFHNHNIPTNGEAYLPAKLKLIFFLFFILKLLILFLSIRLK